MAKLTDSEITCMREYGWVLAQYIPPCPWNPFPHDSDGGRKIEQQYVMDEMAKRRRDALQDGQI